jgi:hypothetical protein
MQIDIVYKEAQRYQNHHKDKSISSEVVSVVLKLACIANSANMLKVSSV